MGAPPSVNRPAAAERHDQSEDMPLLLITISFLLFLPGLLRRGAMTKVTERWFPPSILGKAFALLSLSSRSGSLCAGALLGLLLLAGAQCPSVF